MIDYYRIALPQALPAIEETGGDGQATLACQKQLRELLQVKSEPLMMTSCTHALELACRLAFKTGDEVLLPAYAFPSVANAILLAGARPIYLPIDSQGLVCLDKVIDYMSPKVKGIIVIHYMGNMVDMNRLTVLAKQYQLIVIEDAAQAFLAEQDGRLAGTVGHFGCFSFHATKHIQCGEGGALVMNNSAWQAEAVEFRQKGTNRLAFSRQEVDFYQWRGLGSSYAPADLLMAYLQPQLVVAKTVFQRLNQLYRRYQCFFEQKKFTGLTAYSRSVNRTKVNGHGYFLVFEKISVCQRFKKAMTNQEIEVRAHFYSLADSQFGRRFCRIDKQSDFQAEKDWFFRLVRLPLHYRMTEDMQNKVIRAVTAFFESDERLGDKLNRKR